MRLELRVRGEAVDREGVDAPEVAAPALIVDAVEELMIPSERAGKLRGELVFRFEVVGESIRVSDIRNLEARFVKFRPELPLMP